MLPFRIIKRQEPLHFTGACLLLFTALLLSLLISAFLLYCRGASPIQGIAILFKGAFGSKWALSDSLVKAIPIYLCSLGVAVAFRLKIWNIGAEGQFALGAIGATWVALSFPEWPGYLLMPAMAIAAALFGAFWGFLPALFRQKMKANEIIVTLMLNYIAISLVDFLVYGKWKDPMSFGFPMSPTFPDQAIVGNIGRLPINFGLIHCIILGALLFAFLRFTRTGYELKASGDNVRAAKYAGIHYNKLVYLVMIIGGALAGWGGFLEASATLNRLQPSIIAGYGFTAVIVAWLARLNPFSIAVASFLLAGLRIGVQALQLKLEVPSDFGNILEGLILLTVLASGLFNDYKLVRRSRS